MDPFTQGVLGAAAAQIPANRERVRTAALLGLLGGMAPDLDVLIRSSNDPLLFLEYHRQFTHALAFIPFGGLIVALVLHPLLAERRGLQFFHTWLFCTLGYATHGLLDACTTYGTQLFWPFSNARVAWNVISIIDPLFTVPLALAVAAAAWWRRPPFAAIGLLWALLYLGIGWHQREQAEEQGLALAKSRGHTPATLEAKPSFANILLWKIVYRNGDRFYVDAVRTGWNPQDYPGDNVAVLDTPRDFPWLDGNTQQARDIERFAWFSNGYVALDPAHPDRVIDIRYSLLPNEINALWSLQLSREAEPTDHGDYRTHRDPGGGASNRLWDMLVN